MCNALVVLLVPVNQRVLVNHLPKSVSSVTVTAPSVQSEGAVLPGSESLIHRKANSPRSLYGVNRVLELEANLSLVV